MQVTQEVGVYRSSYTGLNTSRVFWYGPGPIRLESPGERELAFDAIDSVVKAGSTRLLAHRSDRIINPMAGPSANFSDPRDSRNDIRSLTRDIREAGNAGGLISAPSASDLMRVLEAVLKKRGYREDDAPTSETVSPREEDELVRFAALARDLTDLAMYCCDEIGNRGPLAPRGSSSRRGKQMAAQLQADAQQRTSTLAGDVSFGLPIFSVEHSPATDSTVARVVSCTAQGRLLI